MKINTIADLLWAIGHANPIRFDNSKESRIMTVHCQVNAFRVILEDRTVWSVQFENNGSISSFKRL